MGFSRAYMPPCGNDKAICKSIVDLLVTCGILYFDYFPGCEARYFYFIPYQAPLPHLERIHIRDILTQ